MSPEVKDSITIVFSLLGFIAMWFILPIKKATEKANEKAEQVQNELNKHKLHVAEDYVTTKRMDKHFESLEKSIDEVKELVKQNQS